MKRHLSYLAVLFGFAILMTAPSARASGPQCEALFKSALDPRIGKIEVNAMGEPDLGRGVREDAETVARVAHELGLETPAHQLNIVPSGQLDIMAATGGHPAPHWHDGAEVVSAGSKSRGILEFVTKGCPTCRAYYSASTPLTEQRSVIMHVAGHNDMSSTSRYQTIRPGDAPLASFHLAQSLAKAYSEHDHDQVAMYFQFLKSFQGLQDFTNGTFEDPSTFSTKGAQIPLKADEPKSFWEAVSSRAAGGLFDNLLPTNRPRVPEDTSKWNKTHSVLQAMTEMLPPETPEWQVSLLKLYEQTNRPYPATFQTKIMNEGWATLMQYLLARHLPWTSSADLVKFGQLMSGVAYPSFENPYWLGVSGWMNLYEQFQMRPEIQGLSEKEKDKRFIKYARELYANKNDSDWAKIAIDERWIEKNNFFLYRETQSEEVDPSKDPEKQHFIALSRDWKRVRNFIISKYVDVKYRQVPSITILNPQNTQGVISLVQDTSAELPLEISTASKTLFVMAQVLRRPVEIRALWQRSIFEQGEKAQFPAEMAVTPAGTLEGIMSVNGHGQVSFKIAGQEVRAAAQQLEKVIDEYKLNVLGSFHSELSEHQLKQWAQLADKVGDDTSASASVNNIVEYAPNTGPAIREYLQVVEKRLRGAIADALTGKTKTKLGAAGITLPVLPEIPSFHYANVFVQQRIASKPVGPVEKSGEVSAHDFHVDENGTRIGAGPHLPGDKWSPKKKPGDGEGEGKGEGDGDGEGAGKGKGKPGEGEPDGEGEEPSPGHGGGAGNPTDLKIPLKLYGELLGEVLELPNIRRTVGKIPEIQTIRRGILAKPTGNQRWDETMIVAIEKARAIRRGKGLPWDASVPVMDLIREALPLIEPADIRVSGRMEKPLPDFDAVLVVNIDLTGSMAGERIENAKNLVYNMEALLRAKYKNVTIEFVGFDSTARRMTRKEIFSQFFGGGTAYESAGVLDKKILEEYPNSRFNKYVITIGDAETSSQDANAYVREIESIKDDLQYAGLVVTNTQIEGMAAALVGAHKQLQSEWPWVGIGHMRTSADMFQVLRELFKGDGKE